MQQNRDVSFVAHIAVVGKLSPIEHICKTRSFTAGTILGSGTVSTRGSVDGSSCLSERRMLEIIENGEPQTRWMRPGDRVQIDMADSRGRNLFGTIDQRVVAV